MTHAPEISAENPYQKTGIETGTNLERVQCSIRYRKPVPEKSGTKMHVRRARNRYRLSSTGFWRQLLACASLASASIKVFYRACT